MVVEDLHVEVDGKEILTGVNLEIPAGKVNAVMGPNGSGKSTLANTLMGNPRYVVTGGRILYKGKDITLDLPDQRSLDGIFLASQYPVEISGVTLINFLRQMVNAHRDEEMPLVEFRQMVNEKMDTLGMDRAFATRYVNSGFSGGEKKRSEILQLAVLDPTLAILDETDSPAWTSTRCAPFRTESTNCGTRLWASCSSRTTRASSITLSRIPSTSCWTAPSSGREDRSSPMTSRNTAMTSFGPAQAARSRRRRSSAATSRKAGHRA